ncbi:MAG: hypothetical protein ACRDG7_19650 [Candidatus Limnocylindria bacterium]
MGETLELSAEQARAVASWCVAGSCFVPVALVGHQPAFVSAWEPGDILAMQGDAYVHLGVEGEIKSAVPPVGPARP